MNYAATVPITSVETMGWLRTAVGIALIVAPGAPMRLAGNRGTWHESSIKRADAREQPGG